MQNIFKGKPLCQLVTLSFLSTLKYLNYFLLDICANMVPRSPDFSSRTTMRFMFVFLSETAQDEL